MFVVHGLALLVTMLTLAWLQTASAASDGVRIVPGSGSFVFVDEKGDTSKRTTVLTYLPRRLDPRTAPIVFVMHGQSQAKAYHANWIQYADRYQFMLLVPSFDPKQWGRNYSYANVTGGRGKLQDASRWSYSFVEHLFDAVKGATGNESRTYLIYGHSEGGQFVHRFVLALPDARYSRAVAANPGWYTMPRLDVKFPYGLRGSPAGADSLKKALGRDVVLLLGDRDANPNDQGMRQKPEARAQGATRFERGHNFFKEAESRAAELKCAFGWRLETVRGAEHSDRQMARAGAAALMGR
jgi:pimeloyl-ACP methyl ester carboxylesterase